MRKSNAGLLPIYSSACYLLAIAAFFLISCSASKSTVSPYKKYPLVKIQKDYRIFQDMLEESHPSLYWYTPKENMDRFFQRGYQQLKDSMTEGEFRKVLSYVIAEIKCGHTSVRPSKRFQGFFDSVRARSFPFSLKIWSDTAVVLTNLVRQDSVLKRGTVISSINGMPIRTIVDSLSKYLPADGFNQTHKWQTLSNRGFFGSLYTSLFGISEKYRVEYIDSAGQVKSMLIPAYNPAADTAVRSASNTSDRLLPVLTKKERKQIQIQNTRSFRLDSVNHIAFLNLNTFSSGSQVKKFLRSSFRSLQKNTVEYLVIDVRGNGGGSVTNSTIFSRYIADRPFIVADSLYAIKKRSRYGRYIHNNFINWLFINFFTGKKDDGRFHFGYFERHSYKPKKKKHFDGQIYILTGGNSFSATTLFVSSVQKQENVTVVGEETGGGAYGNSAWLIPDVTLPETRVRFRLPLFRLVIDKDIPKDGRGVMPEIAVPPTVQDILKGRDNKMEKIMELIRENKKGRG